MIIYQKILVLQFIVHSKIEHIKLNALHIYTSKHYAYDEICKITEYTLKLLIYTQFPS